MKRNLSYSGLSLLVVIATAALFSVVAPRRRKTRRRLALTQQARNPTSCSSCAMTSAFGTVPLKFLYEDLRLYSVGCALYEWGKDIGA